VCDLETSRICAPYIYIYIYIYIYDISRLRFKVMCPEPLSLDIILVRQNPFTWVYVVGCLCVMLIRATHGMT